MKIEDKMLRNQIYKTVQKWLTKHDARHGVLELGIYEFAIIKDDLVMDYGAFFYHGLKVCKCPSTRLISIINNRAIEDMCSSVTNPELHLKNALIQLIKESGDNEEQIKQLIFLINREIGIYGDAIQNQ